MARLDIPEGDLPEIARVWELRPEMGEAVRDLSIAVYQKSQLPPRVREAARMRIAEINGCVVCQGWRIPELAEQGVDEELYAHVEQWRTTPSTPSRSAWRSSTRSGSPSTTGRIDDAFFARLKEQFTDAEILDLTICIGNWVAFGRLTMVLDLDEACETRIRTTV